MFFIKYLINKFLGDIYFEKENIKKGKKILHISDTPNISFKGIKKFINKVEPDYIIHTGDLADDIKLELYPNKKKIYKKCVKKFLEPIEKKFKSNLIIITGNHDDYKILKDTFKDASIYKEFKTLKIYNKKFLLTHKIKVIKNKKDMIKNADYILYGHNLEDEEFNSDNKFINGLRQISLIYPTIDTIQKYEYPLGTNDSRVKKFRLGI
ncbi:MAG: metallophosphoesterase [Bacillota bacterium]